MNRFSEREIGPMPCDLTGKLEVTIDDEVKEIYIIGFRGAGRIGDFEDIICYYYDYDDSGILIEERKEITFPNLFKALGLKMHKKKVGMSKVPIEVIAKKKDIEKKSKKKTLKKKKEEKKND